MDTWFIKETEFSPTSESSHQAVFMVGNGYFGTRGTFEEGYPGLNSVTLVHGVFDDVPIVHTELVNAPDWTSLRLQINGAFYNLAESRGGKLLDYRRELDLRTGTLHRWVTWCSPHGETIKLHFERFASMAQPNLGVVRCEITAVDFGGSLRVFGMLNGVVANDNILHWEEIEQGGMGRQSSYLTVKTRETDIVLTEAGALTVEGGDACYAYNDCMLAPTVVADLGVESGQTVMVTKFVTLFTSLEYEQPQQTAIDVLAQVVSSGYPAIRQAHMQAWSEKWKTSDIEIEGDDRSALAVRFAMYQLLIAAPYKDLAASIPAKTLSGYGYRGHAFWDTEIFMLPFFTYTQPELARNVLLYRYKTLAGARRKARAGGFDGAMFAWESAATGDETTPRWVPIWDKQTGEDLLVRIWCGDIELHINSDVAYGVMQYWQVTGDDTFMRDYGAEIILDTARFWASRVEWDEESGTYQVNDVIGPDENHDHINNNAYTNGLIRWHLRIAGDIYAWLYSYDAEKADRLTVALDLADSDIAKWHEIIDRIAFSIDPKSKLIEQFDGFFKLRDFDFDAHADRMTSVQGLMGIEETQKLQVLKQPDVLMLFYLLPDVFDSEVIQANWDYYTPRTDHTYGSSLGPAIQSTLASRLGDQETAMEHFERAIQTDLHNVRGNTVEGIHGATCGGIWQAVVFGFAGITETERGLSAHPRLPNGWKRLRFRLCYRGELQEFDLQARTTSV